VLTVIRCALPITALVAVLVAASAAPAGAGPYIVVDAESGRVLAQHEAGRQWYPASVTKLMTVYLTLRAIRAGKLQRDTLLTVSQTAAAEPPSKMGFKPGTQVTVDNALKMLMVKSANDVAVVLAEGVGGSLSGFVEQMNKAAIDLGMNGTQFKNPNGLPHDEQVTTARDMAILARQLIREFPEHEMLFRIPAIRFGKRIMRNHNRLIDRYPGADGMKTGFICASGFNVVATAKRGDKHLIVVLFGAHSSMQRAHDAARLFERNFASSLSLASLIPSSRPRLEQVDNVAVGPVDMREDMCSRKRRKPASESDIDDEPDADPQSNYATLRADEKVNLLVDLPPSMPPIQVFVGARPPAERATPARAATTKARPKAGKKPDAAAKAAEQPAAKPKTKAKSVKPKAVPKAAPKTAAAPAPKPQ
jgi:D-alanyl-D-alanine carboxypeptidase